MSVILDFDFLHQNFLDSLPCLNSRYLLAISGGLDSMALFNLFVQNSLNFSVCHINHNIRPESKIEQSELALYCSNLSIPFFTTELDFSLKSDSESVELWARNSRYLFLSTVQIQNNYDWICTAHHFDDQIETLLQNLLRGCSLTGLRGIHHHDPYRKLIRPLLNISRNQLTDYIQYFKIPFYQDSSNALNIYQRNTLRNKIIPKLKLDQIDLHKLGAISTLAQQQLLNIQLFIYQFKRDYDFNFIKNSYNLKLSFAVIKNFPNIIRMILSTHKTYNILSQSKNWHRIEDLSKNCCNNLDFENFIRAKKSKTHIEFSQHSKLGS